MTAISPSIQPGNRDWQVIWVVLLRFISVQFAFNCVDLRSVFALICLIFFVFDYVYLFMRSNVLTFYIQLRSLFGFTSGLNFCVHFCVQFLGSLFRVHLLYFPSPLHALYTEVLLVFSERGCVSLPDDTLTPMIKIKGRRKFTA